jgi:PPOX class probable F420-dependent enzyme
LALAANTHRVELTDEVRRFLTRPVRYATIATINRDGSPHQTVVWYRLRGDTIVLNSREGRRWPTNLRRDPRVSVNVEDGLDAVTLGGDVEIDDDPVRAQADIAEMARRYDEPAEAEREIARFRTEQRVSFILQPTRIHIHGEPR